MKTILSVIQILKQSLYDYKKYYQNVLLYMKKLDYKSLSNDIRKDFNEQNKKLTINNKKGGFDIYVQAHQKQNINYGLKKYK